MTFRTSGNQNAATANVQFGPIPLGSEPRSIVLYFESRELHSPAADHESSCRTARSHGGAFRADAAFGVGLAVSGLLGLGRLGGPCGGRISAWCSSQLSDGDYIRRAYQGAGAAVALVPG